MKTKTNKHTVNNNTNDSYGDAPDAALRRKIEERAYYIWLENGSRHGDHERHWLEAEKELMETAKKERKQISEIRGYRGKIEGKLTKEQYHE